MVADKITEGNPPEVQKTEGGDSPVTEKSPIDEAKEVLEENKKVLAELKKERERIEKATTQMMMSGKSLSQKSEAPKPETDEEYSARIRRGEL
jgi:hypothetical protein